MISPCTGPDRPRLRRNHRAIDTGTPLSAPRLEYNQGMSKKSLASSNRHLGDATAYRRGLLMNVSSSTAIETGQRVEEVSRRLAEDLAKGKLTRPASRR
jgi:hypothetical protein